MLSGNFFSEVIIPSHVPAHIRIPECYTAEYSRPPTPNFADYPIRVDGITIYDPSHNPRFPIPTERFIANNDLLSTKRKETELKRFQTPKLELKFEVKVKFQCFNPQKQNKKLLLLFLKSYILILKETQIFPLYYMEKFYFTTPTLDLNTQLLFRLLTFIYITTILLYSFLISFTSNIPITPTNTDKYLPSDDPNFTNLLVSHYDCEKQHNLRQFNLLNVKQSTEAPSNIQHASVKSRVYVRVKAKRIKAYKCVLLTPKKKEKFVFKAQSKIVVLIDLYGTTTLCHSPLHLIL